MRNIKTLCFIHSPIECSEEDLFPCSDSSLEEHVCVDELQACDGIAHCPVGSDEPADCGTGNCVVNSL